ncbi:unnamed protein product, partial [Aphanomyces euteiches]
MVLFANIAAAHEGHVDKGAAESDTANATSATSKDSASIASLSPAKKKPATLSVLINGVPVQSPANHIRNGKVYVSVAAFASVLEQEVTLDSKLTISNKGEATAWVKDLAAAIGAQKVSWDPQKLEVYVLALPPGTVPLDPAVVPAMGEHWANPQVGDAPMGPIYGVYKWKLVFIEYMIAQEDFIQGKSHINLGGMKGLPMPRIEQTDIEFQAHGHPGFE